MASWDSMIGGALSGLTGVVKAAIIFFVFARKNPEFLNYIRNRKRVKKHQVFIAIWTSQTENI